MDLQAIWEARETIRGKMAELETLLSVYRQADSNLGEILARESGETVPNTSGTAPIHLHDEVVVGHTPRHPEPRITARIDPGSPLNGKSRLDKIEDVLRASERPLRTAEIVDALIEQGDGKGTDRDMFWNVVDSSLRRGTRKGRLRKVAKGTWALADRAANLGPLNRASDSPKIHAEGIDTDGDYEVQSNPMSPNDAPLVGLAKQVLHEKGGRWMSYQEIARAAAERQGGFPWPLKTYARMFNDAMKQRPEFERQGTFYRLAQNNANGLS